MAIHDGDAVLDQLMSKGGSPRRGYGSPSFPPQWIDVYYHIAPAFGI